ncbi:MAG: ATPase [Flavobacterium psychrophilum]|nr:MAG: ATPase [Flavobacterium psychrophilum]
MKNNLLFDFVVDKEKNTLTIKREFAAPRQLVWDAHTKSELLNQWFAPKPMTTKTKSMDFSEGGHWVYAMIEPNGTEYWGRMDYIKINPIESYTGLDGFCDNTGELNPDLPRASWDVQFKDMGEHSIVENVVTYNSLSDIETIINMGMEEGMKSTLERLDDLLEKLTN